MGIRMEKTWETGERKHAHFIRNDEISFYEAGEVIVSSGMLRNVVNISKMLILIFSWHSLGYSLKHPDGRNRIW